MIPRKSPRTKRFTLLLLMSKKHAYIRGIPLLRKALLLFMPAAGSRLFIDQPVRGGRCLRRKHTPLWLFPPEAFGEGGLGCATCGVHVSGTQNAMLLNPTEKHKNPPTNSYPFACRWLCWRAKVLGNADRFFHRAPCTGLFLSGYFPRIFHFFSPERYKQSLSPSSRDICQE